MSDSHSAARVRTSSWVMTYGALLTGVLAFFLLMVTKAEKEAASTYRFADRMNERIYRQIMREKITQHINWLQVEQTGTRGVKLLIPTEIGDRSLFASGDDAINRAFMLYLTRLGEIISKLHLDRIIPDNQPTIARLHEIHKDIKVQIRVEGHTDIVPIGSHSRFRDNWQLSTARAYQVMRYLMAVTKLPPTYFALAGYGPFHPLHSINNYAENRRVEIYLEVQMVDLANGS